MLLGPLLGSATAGTAIDLTDCPGVNMKRVSTSVFGVMDRAVREGVARNLARLLVLALFASFSAPAVAQEPAPADRGRADSRMDVEAPPQQAEPGEPANPEAKPEPASPEPANPAPVNPEPAKPQSAEAPPTPTSVSICLLIESAAQAHGLPFEFFARLIWQESRFKVGAVGPMTRSGRRALGIAQFMPGTASERGLFDPFDPVAALPKSAEFLEELHGQFGNLGLAAAAYNAGPGRVRAWLAGRSGLPGETRNYVMTITGRSAEEWAAARGSDLAPTRKTSCGELTAMLKEQPSFFVGELERRVTEGAARAWGVEITAGFVRDKVLAAYATMEKSYRTLLENRDPIIIASTFRSRGTQTFYQVRIGADTRGAANDLCAALRKAGGACLVMRNWVGKPSAL
jgi:soluble lytic murein transglycosylase-like protein